MEDKLIPFSAAAWGISASFGSRLNIRCSIILLTDKSCCAPTMSRVCQQSSCTLGKAQGVPNLKFTPAMNFENYFEPLLLFIIFYFLLKTSGESLPLLLSVQTARNWMHFNNFFQEVTRYFIKMSTFSFIYFMILFLPSATNMLLPTSSWHSLLPRLWKVKKGKKKMNFSPLFR